MLELLYECERGGNWVRVQVCVRSHPSVGNEYGYGDGSTKCSNRIEHNPNQIQFHSKSCVFIIIILTMVVLSVVRVTTDAIVASASVD